MIIPKKDEERLKFYRETVEACLLSRQRRVEQYALNRRYYLYGAAQGEVSPWNKIYSHLDTVTAFLYASDSTRFSWKLGSLAPQTDYLKTGAVSKRVNEEWKNSNADIMWQQAILWALVYDSTFVKHIRRGGKVEPFVVDPGSFGVYREDIPMLDRQEAFVHVWYMTPSDLERRLMFHPNKATILSEVSASRGKTDMQTEMPPLIERVSLASMATSEAGMPNVTGQPNINIDTPPEYSAQVDVELIEMQELWVWDSANDDYQTVTMASETAVIYDRPNIFLPRSKEWEGEQPFVQVCPNPLYDLFWGCSEVARLWPLQGKRNERMNDIQLLLAKQVNPPTAFSGMGLIEDKVQGFDNPGTFLAGGDGNFKVERFVPTIPADVYADIKQIDQEFDETSGLTNVTQGRGEAGVRSAGHAGKLLTVGSARPKKRALIIEDSLEKSATLFGKCIYVDDPAELTDEQGHKFVVAQMSPHFSVEVDAHSNSPVFMENQRETAIMLLKAQAINRKRFIQMLAPPMMEELIRDLEQKIIPGEKAAAQARAAAEAAKEQGKGKPGLRAVE